MTKEIYINGQLALSRKKTYGKMKQSNGEPVFTSRMEKREYYKSATHFDLLNVLDVKGFLKEIKANWHTYVSQVHQWIQKNPVKKLIVTGIFTVVLGCFANTPNAAFIQEYTYQVKKGENIETIAREHGVTPQEILEANGISSIDGKKILLPKVEDRTVTASTLNVRSQPNTQSSIIGKYKKGDVVKVTFVENGWAGILIKGRVCFVSADYLTTTKTAAQAKTMYSTAPSLRVREAASTSSAVIDSLKLNDRVDVTSIDNGWAQIQFNGKTAYVSSKYLTSTDPTKVENNTNIRTSSSVYVIKKGDTYTKISKSLGVSVLSIQELNPNVDPSKLKIGQTINIPATTSNQIMVTAQIGGVDPEGTFRFITAEGKTFTAKASGNLINDLFNLQGKTGTLVLEGKRGQHLTLLSLQ